MSYLQITILAVIQGLAELLPVSSSAHVLFAEKLMGIDPSSPEATFFLVMLHTGTMFAVLIYFWKSWSTILSEQGRPFVRALVQATVATGLLGFALKIIIEKVIMEKLLGIAKGEVESMFKVFPLIAAALFAAGVLIFVSGRIKPGSGKNLDGKSAYLIGLVQGLCLPFRGFSRSGATISSALMLGIDKHVAEAFSFALAVILTPPVVVLETHRLIKYHPEFSQPGKWFELLTPGLLGMGLSFAAGLLALRWLSGWLTTGRWWLFGVYCFAAAAVIFVF